MTVEIKNINRSELQIYLDCIQILEEKKALDIVLLDIRDVNSYLDFFIIATGNSHIHCKTLVREVDEHLRSMGMKKINNPDLESGWLILDYGSLTVHIFTQEKREFYQLERLWADGTRVVHTVQHHI